MNGETRNRNDLTKSRREKYEKEKHFIGFVMASGTKHRAHTS